MPRLGRPGIAHSVRAAADRVTLAELTVRALIAARGPLTFAQFMDVALYDPVAGYYAQPSAGPGPQGDYLTSAEVDPAFGALICLQLEQMWQYLDRPDPFWLIEGGPGRGVFAADLLATAAAVFPDFAAALQLALIERSPRLREVQEAALQPWASRVRWLGEDRSGPQPVGPGCVFANELLDALPFHRVVMRPSGLREIYVGLDGDALVEVEGELSSPALHEQLAAGGAYLERDQRAEVSLAAPAWVARACRLLTRGYALLLDYGGPARDLYGAAHPRGTLRCYVRHVMTENPFVRVGRQDITAHVDFSAVTRAAESRGFMLQGASRQRELLRRLGLPQIVAAVPQSVGRRVEQWARARALHLLQEPRGLGGVLAVVLGLGAPSRPLWGFSSAQPAALPPRFPVTTAPRVILRAAHPA